MTDRVYYDSVWVEGEDRFSSCSLCGAIVDSTTAHDEWHRNVSVLALGIAALFEGVSD